jgi:hypothetical protein
MFSEWIPRQFIHGIRYVIVIEMIRDGIEQGVFQQKTPIFFY